MLLNQCLDLKITSQKDLVTGSGEVGREATGATTKRSWRSNLLGLDMIVFLFLINHSLLLIYDSNIEDQLVDLARARHIQNTITSRDD